MFLGPALFSRFYQFVCFIVIAGMGIGMIISGLINFYVLLQNFKILNKVQK